MMKVLLSLGGAVLLVGSAPAQHGSNWLEPFPKFRITGNLSAISSQFGLVPLQRLTSLRSRVGVIQCFRVRV